MSRLRPEAIGAIVGVVLVLGSKLSQLASYEGEYYIGYFGLMEVFFGSVVAGLMGAGLVWVCRRALGMPRANAEDDTGVATLHEVQPTHAAWRGPGGRPTLTPLPPLAATRAAWYPGIAMIATYRQYGLCGCCS